MSHPAQRAFVQYVKGLHPEYFQSGRALDVGSQDINGSNRSAFDRHVNVLGIDIGPGKGVDLVAHCVDFYATKWNRHPFDVVISTEALEHDSRWEATLQAMWAMLRPGGLLVLTCAGPGRPEHGTHQSKPEDSPHTKDHYRNLDMLDIKTALGVAGEGIVSEGGAAVGGPVFDTHYYCVKAI